MGKVLIWFVIIISTVVLYCLMKVKAESDELYEELIRYGGKGISFIRKNGHILRGGEHICRQRVYS